METLDPQGSIAIQPLSKRLKQDTQWQHDSVERSMTALRPFESRQGYVRLLTVQYLFQRHMMAFYRDAALVEWIPDLPERCRYSDARRDCEDLDIDLAALDAQCPPAIPVSSPTALGWLYVNEGSNLGAAFLFKSAVELGMSESFGARHLAPRETGRGLHWRTFTRYLDAIPLSDSEKAWAIAGARDAFAHVESLARPLAH
ncbi:biliverdin-producing heme oxygenase [Billgrantia gudaonensis]|uniref:Heme oxygenase n=1 Tax=Billgrantia gudaonensis TaxID=376427 RepID=A0A1G8VR55_9GAMM|nr:biliverdin-producing heme oxygenase [Halomonas gudaonensis]SDJ68561.1 heme oxygenase [Halomonas gudaonensis]